MTEFVHQDSEEKVETTPPPRAKRHSGGGAWLAILLLFLGGVFLLNNFGLLPWDIWSNLWRFWPVFLILFGLQIVLGRNWFAQLVISILGILAIVVILLVASFSNNDVGRFLMERFPQVQWQELGISTADQERTKQITISQLQYPDVRERQLGVRIGSATVHIDEGTDSAHLDLVARYQANQGEPEVKVSSSGGVLRLDVEARSRHGFMMWGAAPECDLSLGMSEIPTGISIDLGSGEGELRLDRQRVGRLDIDLGSGSLQARLGTASVPSSRTIIKIGSGDLELEVPQGVGVRINHQIGSGQLRFENNNLEREGEFKTQNYDSSGVKWDLDIDIGSGHVSLKTY